MSDTEPLTSRSPERQMHDGLGHFSTAAEPVEVPMQDVSAPPSGGKAPVSSSAGSWLIKLERRLRGVYVPTDEKLVLFVIAGHANEDGVTWVSQETIAFETGLGLTKLGEAIRALERHGHFTRSRALDHGRIWMHTVYRLSLDGGGWERPLRQPRGGGSSRGEPPGGVVENRPAAERQPSGGIVDHRPAVTKLPEEKLPSEAPRREAPTPDRAHARVCVEADHRGPGDAPIPPRPTLADLAVPRAADPPQQPAEKRDSTQQGLFGEEEQPVEPAKKGARVRGHDVAAVAEQVHAAHVAAWRKAGRKGHEPVMNAKRRKLVEARLADGYSPERLGAAVRGILSDGSWHRDNGFADIDHALKDGAAVEKFESLAAPAKEPKPEPYRAPRPELPPGAKPVDWNEWRERLRSETDAWNARRAQGVSRG